MDEGLPASTHVSLPVSFTELVISCACPLARLKLNDSSNPDPWLLTTKRPSDEELYVLEQATKKAINSSAPAPRRPAPSHLQMRENLNPFMYQESAGRANSRTDNWNQTDVQKLPAR